MWPEAASGVQLLLVPKEGLGKKRGGASTTPSSSSSSSLCHVEFCEGEGDKGGLLKVVTSDESRTVMDVMNVDDVIGASIEVTMATSTTTSTTTTTAEDGGGGPNALEMKQLVAASSPSETLTDTRGFATLHVYCYPKQVTPSRGGPSSILLRRLGLISKPGAGPDVSSTLDEPANVEISAPPLPRKAAHRAYVLAPVEDLSHVQVLVRAIQHLARGGGGGGGGPASASASAASSDGSPPPRETYLVLVNPVSGTGQAERETRHVVVPMLEQAGIDAKVVVTRHPGHAYEICRNDAPHGSGDDESSSRLWDGVTGIVVVGGDGVFHELVNALSESKDLQKYKMGMVPCGTGSGLAASIAHASREQCTVLSCTYLLCKGHVVEADTSTYATTNKTHTSFLTYSWGLVADVDMESECIRWLGTARLDLWAVYRILFLRTYRGRLSYTTRPVTSLPPLTEPVPDDWTVLEDDGFILFWASQVTHASMGFYHSPFSKVGDGNFQIMVVRRPVSRLQMIRILLSIDAGEHVHLRGVEFIQCAAYRLEPTGSFNVIDGEKVEAGPVQAHVVPKSLRVFGRCRSGGQ